MLPLQRRYRLGLGLLAVVGVVAGGLQVFWPINAADTPKKSGHRTKTTAAAESARLRVATVSPTVGGPPRQTSLPCSAHWYDSADLYAKVSGYLHQLDVDIGSRVTKGQVLAKIDVPELERDVEMAAATLKHTQASVRQTEARKKSAMAEQRAAVAACVKAEADLDRWTAEQTFREKEYHRFQNLNKSESVQAALVDEKLFQLQSVQAGRRSAETAILTAKEQATAAAARVELADADLHVAAAQVEIAAAGLAKARMYASFSQILSPYDGVVTSRHFHPGEFIRAADKGAGEALLKVGRTDLIRVVVYIPDREVPFAHLGDPVTIEFDALPGRTFPAKLDRIAYSEEVTTRTMRAEADLPNDEGLIVDQMYGRMLVHLEPASKTLSLPSTCLVGDLKDGKGQVYVVKDDVAQLKPITVGAHDGVSVEVLDGVSAQDLIVAQPPPGLTEGTAVSGEKTPEK